MSDPQLRRRLDRWVTEGLIEPPQVARILAAEQTGTAEGAEAATPDRPAAAPATPAPAAKRGPMPVADVRRSLVVEAVGYLGGALAVIAGFLSLGELWPDITQTAQLILAGISTAVLLGAGAAVRAERDPALERLRGVLWLVSAATVGWFTAVLSDWVLDWRNTFLLASAVTTAYGALLWYRSRAPLQHLTVFVGLAMVVNETIHRIDEHAGPAATGLGVWSLSALWWAAAYGRLIRPRTVGLLYGSVGLLYAALTMLNTAAGHVLALCTSALLIAAGVHLRQVWLLALGAVGVLVVVPQTATRYLPQSAGGPIAIFVAGLALLGVALWLGRHQRAGTGHH